MKPVRILIAEDHIIVRQGIRLLLERIPDVEVVGETNNGRAAIEMAKTVHPNIALLDISMPELNGLEAAAQIKKHFPEIRILILSVHKNEEYVDRALQVGVSGYLVKESTAEELEIAIKAISKGDVYFSTEVTRLLLTDYVKHSEPKPASDLTSRQTEILQLITEGYTTKEISTKLKLSVKTVNTHRTGLMRRLNIHDVTGLVRYAIRTGLIQSED